MTLTIPPTVLEWSRGFASLSPGIVPCRGLRDEEWRETHRRCQEFVERWGMQAHAAGWETLHLFGVDPDRERAGVQGASDQAAGHDPDLGGEEWCLIPNKNPVR